MDNHTCPFSPLCPPFPLAYSRADKGKAQTATAYYLRASNFLALPSNSLVFLPLSFRLPSGGLIKCIPKLFIGTMKQLSREQAEQHLTISNIALFLGSLLVGNPSWNIYGRLLRRLKASLAGKVSYSLIIYILCRKLLHPYHGYSI